MQKKRWLLLFSLLTVVTVILAACGDDDEPAELTTIIIGTTDTLDDLDPGAAYAIHDWEIFRNINEGLLKFTPGTLDIEFGTAESYDVSDDGKTYTFHLRDNVMFPDGTELTAGILKRSLDRVGVLDQDVSFLETGYVESVQAPDDQTLIINLLEPFGFFPQLVTTAVFYPAHPDTFEESVHNPFPTAPVMGVGPYQLVEYDVEEQSVLEPNPNYYGDVPTTRVIVRYFQDPAQMALALENGDIDIAWRSIAGTEANRLRDVEGITRFDVDGGSIRYIVVNHDSDEPWSDPNVSSAFAALLDRDELADRAGQGFVVPLFSMVPPGFLGATEAFQDFYDAPNPDLALELLAKSGYGPDNPVELDLWYPPDHYGGLVAATMEVIKEQAEATGAIKLNIRAQDWGTYIGAGTNGEYGAFILGWFFDYPDSDNYLSPFSDCEGSADLGVNYCSEEYQALLEEARSSSDPDRRAALYEELQTIYAQDTPTIPYWFEPEYLFYRDGIEGAFAGPDFGFVYSLISKAE